MADWERIIELYESALSRVGTPYEQFGEKMLSLISRLRSEVDLTDVEVYTAMYTLEMHVRGKMGQIKVTWAFEGHYSIALVPSPIQSYPEEFSFAKGKVGTDAIIPTIESYLDQLRSEKTFN